MDPSKILIIDDERLLCQMLNEHLSKTGYIVRIAMNGTDGLATAHEILPDVIILDVFMPGINGIAVCKALKESSVTGHIPVIFITGDTNSVVRLRCLEAGANDFISKPIEPIELNLRIKNLIAFTSLVTVSNENRELAASKLLLEQTMAEMKLMQSQLLHQEKMASIGQLAAGIAHEINNPTGFIMSNLVTLRKYVKRLKDYFAAQDTIFDSMPPDSATLLMQRQKDLKINLLMEDLPNLITESVDGAERIKKIVQDLKGFSRSDGDEHKVADINAGIESTVNIVWNELKYKAIVNKNFGDIPTTKCNPGQLNQVFMNILVNAAQAIEIKGEITIRSWLEDERINVAISDTGCGIPQEKINKIFEPFYTTKDVGKGTGLGLSIAYDIVRKHNGNIVVTSEVGKGTTFTISIPVTA